MSFYKQERKNIKSTFSEEDVRRKRVDKHLTLRKQKKEELLLKRRKAETIDPTILAKLQNVPKYFQQLSSNNVNEQLEATIQFRKLLSMERNPPIDQIVNAGVLPIFVQFLQRVDQPQLQFEAAWAITNIASGTSEHVEKVIQSNAPIIFIQLLNSPNDDIKEQCVWALGNIAGDSAKFRDYLLQLGVMPPLLKLITANPSPKVSLMRNAVWTLSNLCRGKPQPEFNMIAPALLILAHLLYHPDEEVITDASWALSYITDGPNDRIQAAIDANIIPRLVELLMHHSSTVQTPALRALGNIVTGNDKQTQAVLNAGILRCLTTLIGHSKKSIRKEVCWTISNVTAGSVEQIQEVIDANLIPALIFTLQKDEFDVKREAAWAISNATSGGTEKQIKYIVDQGVIKPLCDLLQYKDVKLVNVVLEALDNILAAGASEEEEHGFNPYTEKIEEAEGIEKLEELQSHENEEIYDKVVSILEQYFGVEEEVVPDSTDGFTFDSNVQVPQGGFQF